MADTGVWYSTPAVLLRNQLVFKVSMRRLRQDVASTALFGSFRRLSSAYHRAYIHAMGLFPGHNQARLEQIREQVQSADNTTRGRAINELSILVRKDSSIRDDALRIFKSAAENETDPWPASTALHGIEFLEGAAAARPYRLAMLRHPITEIVERTAMSVQDPSYVPELLGLLERRQEPRIQMTVIRALGRLKDPAAFPAILARLEDAELRPHVVEALGDLGDARAIPFLEPMLQDGTPTWPIDNHGPMLYIRDHAATSIEQIRASNSPHHPPSSTPAPQGMPMPQSRIVVPPPIPTPRRAVNLRAYMPLIAAVTQVPWIFIVIVLQLMRAGTQKPDESLTHLLDFIAMIPAIVGVLVGIYAARRWPRMIVVEKVFLVVGLIICVLIMIPFAAEMTHQSGGTLP